MDFKKGIEFRNANPESYHSGNSWFLGIGINNYSSFSNLNNAVRDVKDIFELLNKKYEIDKSILLFEKNATKAKITSAFDQLVNEVKANDKLLIYYSGHGAMQNQIGYWIPVDAEKGKRGTYFRNHTLHGYLKDISARHILLISDSCFSGTLILRDDPEDFLGIEEMERERSRWVISSGRKTEKVADGVPGGNSPFTEQILKILLLNQKSKLNVAVLADKVAKRTRFSAIQMPLSSPLHDLGHEGGQYIFCLKYDEKKDWIFCCEKDSVEAYQLHVKKYPEGKWTNEAKERIKKLEEAKRKIITNEKKAIAEKNILKQERFKRWQNHLKKYSLLVIFSTILLATFWWTSNQKIKKETIKNEALVFGKMKYPTFQFKGKTWLAKNLNYNLPNSWCYDNDPQICTEYGRLYTWEAAIRACSEIGDGWRLPTDNDWEELITGFGGYLNIYESLVKGEPHKTYDALMSKSYNSFNGQLGGHGYGSEHKEFEGITESGGYWGSNELTFAKLANYYNLTSNKLLVKSFSSKSTGYSCRCVKDNDLTNPNSINQRNKEVEKDSLIPTYNYKLDNNFLVINISGGIPPFKLQLSSNDTTRYEQQISEYGEKVINLSKYQWGPRKFSGKIVVLDSNNRKASSPVSLSTIQNYNYDSINLAGKTYPTITIAGKTWLAKNLDYIIPNSICYNNDPEYCEKYGRLYTWEAAKKACSVFGWRLASKEEWRNLIISYGGSGELDDKSNSPFRSLIVDGRSGLNIQLSGGFISDIKSGVENFGPIESDGLYWSNTKSAENMAWLFHFSERDHTIQPTFRPTSYQLSCRCIKD